eukprot:5407647-Amphidinium_carterae.1
MQMSTADAVQGVAKEDLEWELLGLIGEGQASILKMQRLATSICSSCGDVPQHIHELARLAESWPSHAERDLHRW